jgi:arginase
VQVVPARACRRLAGALLGAYAARRLTAQARRLWALEVDILDESVMPAVTFAQPCGLDSDEVVALIAPLLAWRSLVGLSIADYIPNRDVGGIALSQLIASLAVLAAGASGRP